MPKQFALILSLTLSLFVVACSPNEVVESQVRQDSGYLGSIFTEENAAPVLDFTQEDYEKAQESGQLIFLYFYADWCPLCRIEFPKMVNAFNELDSNEVIGFRVNFNDDDTDEFEANLAKELGITYQHQKVLLKNGEQVDFIASMLSQEEYLEILNTHL